jgi:hypothetical protein
MSHFHASNWTLHGARKLTFKCNYDNPADALRMKCGTKVENRIIKNRSHEHKGAVEIAPRGRRVRGPGSQSSW